MLLRTFLPKSFLVLSLASTLSGCGNPRAVMLPLQYPDGKPVVTQAGEPVMVGYQTYGSATHAETTALYEMAKAPTCATCARVGAVVSEPSLVRQVTGVVGTAAVGAGAVMTGIGMMDYGAAAREGKLADNYVTENTSVTNNRRAYAYPVGYRGTPRAPPKYEGPEKPHGTPSNNHNQGSWPNHDKPSNGGWTPHNGGHQTTDSHTQPSSLSVSTSGSSSASSNASTTSSSTQDAGSLSAYYAPWAGAGHVTTAGASQTINSSAAANAQQSGSTSITATGIRHASVTASQSGQSSASSETTGTQNATISTGRYGQPAVYSSSTVGASSSANSSQSSQTSVYIGD